MKKHYTFLIGLAILCLPISIQAQLFPNLGGQRAGISALTFLKMDVNPRSSAMGGANVCLKGDAFSTSTNPATLAEAGNFNVGLSHTLWVAGIQQSFLSVAKETKIGTFAGSVNFLGSGAMPVRTSFQPDGTGEMFYANYYSVGLTYAKTLTDYFSYGGTIKLVREQLSQLNATTATLDLGFLYRMDIKDLSFAVNVQNFGFNAGLKGNWKADTAFYNPVVTLENYPPPTVFQLGVSMVPYKTDDQSLTVAVQLNHPNDNAENIRLGAEYNFKSILFARAGYKINVKDAVYPTAGVGLRMRIGRYPLRLDYGFEGLRYLGVIHKVGLSLAVNKPEKR